MIKEKKDLKKRKPAVNSTAKKNGVKNVKKKIKAKKVVRKIKRKLKNILTIKKLLNVSKSLMKSTSNKIAIERSRTRNYAKTINFTRTVYKQEQKIVDALIPIRKRSTRI